MNRSMVVATGLFLSVSPATIACAQTAEPEAAEKEAPGRAANVLLEDIVVTAQKKSAGEAAQKVPIALTAFSAETIKATLSDNLRDIGFYSPNTTLQNNPTATGTASFGIRGQGSTESTESVESTVGLVKDGLVYAQRYGSFIETFDLESIEILRGPQGTLFGRNATGGVVNVRSRRPRLQGGIHGQVRTVIGTKDRFDVMGYADVTLIPDKLGLIVSAARLREDGPLKNINAIGGTLGDRSVENYRAALLIRPSDEFDLTLTVEQNRDGSDTTPSRDPLYAPNFFEANRDLDNQINLKATSYIADANVHLPIGTVTVIAGYRDTSYRDNGIADLDGGPLRAFGFRENLQHRQSSLEVRFASEKIADRIEFTVGGFVMDQELELVSARYVAPPAASAVVVQPLAATQNTFSAAVFGQGDIDLFDGLVLTLGGRFTKERKDFRLFPQTTNGCGTAGRGATDFLPDISACPLGPVTTGKWSDFSPLVRLTYKPSRNFLAYASYSKGFRSGGFNSRALASGLIGGRPVAYNDESARNIEFGFKSEWFGKRLRINGAAFENKVNDLQRNVTGPPPTLVSTILNAGKATFRGVEVDITAVAIQDGLTMGDSLVFAGNYGYINADYTFFDTNGDGISDADHLEFYKTPPHNFAISGIYDTPVSDIGNIALRLAYRFEDKTFPDTLNRRAKLPSVGELDASISFTDSNDRFTLRAYARNLTNAKALFQVLPVINDTLYPRPGRRLGVEASFKF